MSRRILVVEDDLPFARALGAALHRAGFEVDHAATGREALSAPPCDLVLLDLGLPDADGTDVCRQLRSRSDVGIIVVSARREERHRVAGLRCGADDYVVKPFSFAELHARVDAVMRRARPRPSGVRQIGRLRVDPDRHAAFVDATPVVLSRKQFQVLALLADRPGSVVRREVLMSQVWRTSQSGVSQTLNVHVATLRAKLGDAARIDAVRGIGYRIVAR